MRMGVDVRVTMAVGMWEGRRRQSIAGSHSLEVG